MSLEEQVDREFATASRRAWMRKLGRLLFGKAGTGTLQSFEAVRQTVGACGGVRRGRRTVETARIVGSTGKNEWFDEEFMPLRGASRERGKRIDLAYHRAEDLPPVSLYKLGDSYFVLDGNHRVSVAHYHGTPTLEAVVTEYRPAASVRHSARNAQTLERTRSAA